MFVVRCPLRWSDLDAQGHVNNALVVDYLQEARVAFLRGGPASDLLDSGIVVVGHQVDYRASIAYRDDGVDIELGVSALGGARFELSYELTQVGVLVARARTVLCPFDFEQNRPIRLAPHIREFLAGHLTDVEPLGVIEAPRLAGRGTVNGLPVRWSDLDAFGHVNNAKVYDYVQQARVSATTKWDPTMARAGAAGTQRLWLVARQDVDYLAQMPHRVEPYAVRTAPVRVGNTSMVLAFEIFDPAGGLIFARGRTVLVCADLDMRPTALPEDTRERLAEHLVT